MSGAAEDGDAQPDERWHLFVGGPLDGQLIDIQGHPVCYEQRLKIDGQEIVHEYVLQPIEAAGRFVAHFYCHTGMPLSEAVLRMMARYVEIKRFTWE